MRIDFLPINQHTDDGGIPLPTGCEATALAAVLRFYGVNANKNSLAAFLPRGEAGLTDPSYAFVGNPAQADGSFGAYVPVLAGAAREFLRARGLAEHFTVRGFSDLTQALPEAVPLSGGLYIKELAAIVGKGIPVAVWMTRACAPPHPTEVWTLHRGGIFTAPGTGFYTVRWIAPEHCAVLTGISGGWVSIADPDGGVVREFSIKEFEAGYCALGAQSLMIQRK
ncbi:MAG: C39 family peptidase [Oscillospiraceae bacterium]